MAAGDVQVWHPKRHACDSHKFDFVSQAQLEGTSCCNRGPARRLGADDLPGELVACQQFAEWHAHPYSSTAAACSLPVLSGSHTHSDPTLPENSVTADHLPVLSVQKWELENSHAKSFLALQECALSTG